jgi:hypothetical protein
VLSEVPTAHAYFFLTVTSLSFLHPEGIRKKLTIANEKINASNFFVFMINDFLLVNISVLVSIDGKRLLGSFLFMG